MTATAARMSAVYAPLASLAITYGNRATSPTNRLLPTFGHFVEWPNPRRAGRLGEVGPRQRAGRGYSASLMLRRRYLCVGVTPPPDAFAVRPPPPGEGGYRPSPHDDRPQFRASR